MLRSRHIGLVCLAIFTFTFASEAQSGASAIIASAQRTGKAPVIIIPGISGSELIDSHTGKTVWFSLKRGKDDDARLPMTSAVLSQNRDSLRAGDIIRAVKVPVLPDVEVYQALIDALIERGYTEGDWRHPKATDVFYVFAYDWRRDNVESAQLLMQKMIAVKRAVRKPKLKFDIIAHSMGGLIARYAAMYGSADLPRDGVTPVPTWAGAAHINKLMMFGTPNEGSFSSLDALLNGYPIIADRKLPFVDDLRPEDVMSNPSTFQLIPHQASARFFDEDLKPIKIDLYDPATWAKYGWGAVNDPKFLAKLKDGDKSVLSAKERKALTDPKNPNIDDRLLARTTVAQVRAYFASALNRAKRFHAALDAVTKSVPIQLFAYGSNCKPTLDAAIIIRDDKKDRWVTIVEPRDLKTSAGVDIKKDALKTALYSTGDGRVTTRSLLNEAGELISSAAGTAASLFSLKSSFFGCSSHTQLFLDKPIQESFLGALDVEKPKQP